FQAVDEVTEIRSDMSHPATNTQSGKQSIAEGVIQPGGSLMPGSKRQPVTKLIRIIAFGHFRIGKGIGGNEVETIGKTCLAFHLNALYTCFTSLHAVTETPRREIRRDDILLCQMI